MSDFKELVIFLTQERGWSQRGEAINWSSRNQMRMEGTQINFWSPLTRVGVTVYFPDKTPHLIQVMPIYFKYQDWIYDHYGSWRADYREGIEVNLMHPTSLEELSEYLDDLIMSRMDWFEKAGFRLMRWWRRWWDGVS